MLAKIDALERLSRPRDRGLMTADTGLTGGGMNSRMKLMPIVAMSAVLLASCADAKEGEANATTQPPPSVHTQSDEGPIYFNISDDPYSPSFLHLDEIERQEGNAFLVARTDLFNRGQPNAFALRSSMKASAASPKVGVVFLARLLLIGSPPSAMISRACCARSRARAKPTLGGAPSPVSRRFPLACQI